MTHLPSLSCRKPDIAPNLKHIVHGTKSSCSPDLFEHRHSVWELELKFACYIAVIHSQIACSVIVSDTGVKNVPKYLPKLQMIRANEAER